MLLLAVCPLTRILPSLFLKAMATLAQYLQKKGSRLVDPFEEHRQATVSITEAVAVVEEVIEEDTSSYNSYSSSESETELEEEPRPLLPRRKPEARSGARSLELNSLLA